MERYRLQADSEHSLQAWALWVLASAVGGAAGGAVIASEFLVTILFGLVFGAAQALILWHYFREASGPWLAASFGGWIAGWLVFSLVEGLTDLLGIPASAQRAVSAVDLLAGSAGASSAVLGPLVVFMVLAASQGVALALVALAFGRRSVLPLAALWPLAGTLGGVLAVTANYYLTNAMVGQSDAGFFLDAPIPQVTGKAAAGALYGAATGVVFAMLARRSEPHDTHPPAHPRPRLSRIAAGLAALLVLVMVGAWGAYESTTPCSDEVRAALEEFPQYGDREIEPDDTPEGRCGVRFYTADPEGEIFAYYVERLRENGWEVEIVPESVSELAGPTGPEETAPARVVSSTLRARRGGDIYEVRYIPQPESDEAGILVTVN